MAELQIPAERDIQPERLRLRAAHLADEIAQPRSRSTRLPRRSRLVAVAGLAAAGAVAAAVFAGLDTEGDGTASAAAAVLRDAAATARAQPSLPELERGEYLYVKSANAYMSTWVESEDLHFTVLVPRVRETWIGPTGGVIRERSGTPSFLTERDRKAWIKAGRPELAEAPGVSRTGPQEPLDLPADADALYSRLEQESAGHSEGVYQEMFTLVGDALRETNATPEQRAALYEVAARIPGVELLGEVRDRAGRTGLAVAIRNPADGVRETLIFDPETTALLGEQQVALAGNQFGYPDGEAVGYATYFGWSVVGSTKERPAP
jgi:RNA polymerase sigma-70 factor (ECF subfamily)